MFATKPAGQVLPISFLAYSVPRVGMRFDGWSVVHTDAFLALFSGVENVSTRLGVLLAASRVV